MAKELDEIQAAAVKNTLRYLRDAQEDNYAPKDLRDLDEVQKEQFDRLQAGPDAPVLPEPVSAASGTQAKKPAAKAAPAKEA